MSEWLEYEVNPYCEKTDDLIVDYDVVIKRLEDLVCCSVQKYYDAAQNKILWRSLDTYRRVFRSGRATREEAAQEIIRECPLVRRRMRGKKVLMAQRASRDTS